MIILLFGQPASGKTTLANEFTEAYHKARIDTDIWKDIYSSMTSMYKSFVLIDGDRWRDITQNKKNILSK